MKNMTFAINTTESEAEYFDLLLKSIYKNTMHKNHEILVFVDSDKGGLIEQVLQHWKGAFNELNIIWNPLDMPIGYQRNINILIEKAKYNIVSYLQSDMYVCKNYDIKVQKYVKPGTVVSSTRVEPPLHPLGPDKITKNFGLTPIEFKEEGFIKFCESISEDKLTLDWWAPFTLYKNDWLAIGGHDTAFRRACEDTDVLSRLILNGTTAVQTWAAHVYHFTCVSSRGKNWFKDSDQEAQRKRRLQLIAQNIDSQKIVYKWGEFKHSAKKIERHKYYLSAIIQNAAANLQLLCQIAPYFRKIYVETENIKKIVVDVLKKNTEVDGKVFVAGAELLHDKDDWNSKYMKYYNIIDFSNMVEVYDNDTNNAKQDEAIIEFDIIKFNPTLHNQFIISLNDLIHYSTEEGNTYKYKIFTLTVNKKINHVKENIIVHNPPINWELKKEKR